MEAGMLTIVEVLWTLLLLVSNALAAVLWQKIKRLDADLKTLEEDMYNLKFNYLGRFEDVKKHHTELQLELITKLVTLGMKIDSGFQVNKDEHQVLKDQAIANREKIQLQNESLLKLNTLLHSDENTEKILKGQK